MQTDENLPSFYENVAFPNYKGCQRLENYHGMKLAWTNQQI